MEESEVWGLTFFIKGFIKGIKGVQPGLQKELQEGIQKGFQEGIRKWLQQELILEVQELLINTLLIKFSKVPKYMKRDRN